MDTVYVNGVKQSFKRLDYEYDLISGKVNTLVYQKGQGDQFQHRYEYDADNRITNVFTSRDGVIWDQDAKYYYYKHGPLARTEFNEQIAESAEHAAQFKEILAKAEKRFNALKKVEERHANAYKQVLESV